MGLFKSKEERRVEREMAVRRAVRSIEKAIVEQGKFSEQFITQAQQAKRIGDQQQYQFIRSNLKKTASIKRMLERQLVAINSAMLLQKQAGATQQFAGAMGTISTEIGKVFGELDLTKTQVNWQKALNQSQALEERMGLFLDSMEQSAGQSLESTGQEIVSDDEIDRMIEADVLAAEQAELSKIDALEAEIQKELEKAKQKN